MRAPIVPALALLFATAVAGCLEGDAAATEPVERAGRDASAAAGASVVLFEAIERVAADAPFAIPETPLDVPAGTERLRVEVTYALASPDIVPVDGVSTCFGGLQPEARLAWSVAGTHTRGDWSMHGDQQASCGDWRDARDETKAQSDGAVTLSFEAEGVEGDVLVRIVALGLQAG